MKKKREISNETRICINRISLYEDFLSKKESLLEELKKYNEEKQHKIIKELIEEERKYVSYLVTRKNIFIKENNYELVESTRKHIKEMYKFIEWCMEYKNNLLKEVVVKEEKIDELILDLKKEELEKIDKLNNENNLNILEDILSSDSKDRYENVINIRKEYIKLYSNEKDKLEVLKEANNLRTQLNKNNNVSNTSIKEVKDNVAILNKIILFLNRVISIDNKKLPKEERKKTKEKEVTDKISKSQEKILREISLSNDELVYNYKELLFETKNIIFIRKLMEEFPDIYTLKDGKNHLVFDTILEQYTNILLNKNFTLEETEKQKIKKEKTLEEIEYYESIILEYITFAKEKKLDFVEGSITKRVDQVINLIENNEMYMKKGKNILSHLSSIVEALNISGLDYTENVEKTITDEFIFSIDSDRTKTKENAMSIKLVDNMYHLNVYVTDLSGFIIHNQKFMTRAQNKLLYNNEDDRIFSGQLKSMFSLNQGKSRKAIGYHLIMDKNLKVIDFKIEKNVINLNRNFKESEVNDIIENNLIQKGCNEIRLLNELLSSQVDGEIINPAQYIITFITRTVSRKLGEYCYLQGINCLYNVNGQNHYVIRDSEELKLENAYVKFSAPLRNYASLVNQLAILGYENAKREIYNTYLLLNKGNKSDDDKTKVKK